MTTFESHETARVGTVGDRLLAVVALAVALLLLRLPLRHTTRVVRVARRAGRRHIAPKRAATLVAAVRHAGRWWPGRVACLETSLAACLAAALLGRELTWCLGGASPLLPPSTTPGSRCLATVRWVSTS
ncbi:MULTISPECIES: lasso peptide biosynthesis B2 protein [Actinosynnema]|uniref:lasso peptide biosynthesis B2 protein n=1 Tax=Actinosynnema TaxID=40566 RepID=UPI0020A58CE3|nr:lasso peptide biosynthesis B2 protein [Actinosynnema pretiosum]